MAAFFAGRLESPLNGAFICRSASAKDNAAMTTARSRRPVLPRRGMLAGIGLLCLAQAGAWASHRDDQDRARAAVLAGEVLPLQTLLERLQRTRPGQVLALELERSDGRWVYEIKLLQPDGQLVKLEVDAATAEVLNVKRKDGARPDDRR